jgi:hypothetical protein
VATYSCKGTVEVILDDVEEGKDDRLDAEFADPARHVVIVFGSLVTTTCDFLEFVQVCFWNDGVKEMGEAQNELAYVEASFGVLEGDAGGDRGPFDNGEGFCSGPLGGLGAELGVFGF